VTTTSASDPGKRRRCRQRVIRASLLGLASALTVSGTQAQQQDAGQKTIVVTGERQTTEKQAESYVRQVVSINDGQLARFLDPVCPEILGVRPADAHAMEDRIRRIAAAAGVRVARGKCEPNLVAAVTRNADSFVKYMRKHHSSFFDDLSDADIHEAFKSGAVHSWRLIETRNVDGDAQTTDSSGDGPPMIESFGSSAFSLPTQGATVNAVIVLGKQAVVGKSFGQVADYIAMRTLTGARAPEKRAEMPQTILSLFDTGAPPPKGLTGADAKFLAGFYSSTPTVSAPSQFFDIAHRMVRGSDSNARR
jgi:hypothetical protein